MEPIDDVSDIASIIMSERMDVERRFAPSPFRDQMLLASSWAFSYELADPAQDEAALQVGLYHPFLSESEVQSLTPGCAFAFAKAGWVDRHDRELQHYAGLNTGDPNVDVAQQVEHLRRMIEDYSMEPDRYASAECTVGIHFAGGEIRLSEVLHPGAAASWRQSD